MSRKKSEYQKRLDAVQKVANKYARLRDCFGTGGASCISCGVWKSFEELDGGHFIPATASSVRFDERNINAQCHRCNRFLHGFGRGYYRGMLQKYGQAVIDDLEAHESDTKKWTQGELDALKAYFKEKINAINSGRDPREEDNTGLAMSSLFKDLSEAGAVPQ